MTDFKSAILAKVEEMSNAQAKTYEPKYGGKDHSGYDALMKYEVNYERQEAFDAALPIIRELLDICEAQANEIGDMRKQFEWYDKVFNGEEHEFAHWWRVEIPYQMDRALTAATERLKQLAGEGE